MKKILQLGMLVLATVFMVTSCAITTDLGSSSNNDTVYELVVVHTNDHHGAVESKDGLGGLALRATLIEQIRAENENVLLLDAGDINTGTALSNMFKAEPDIKAYNALKYDAVTFGNHEFDNDQALLEKQIKDASFPWICANIKRANGKYLDEAYIVKDFKGFKVGVFGLTTQRTLTTASPDDSLVFLDEVEVAKEMVTFLRDKKKVDVVILLGHLGSVEEAKGQNTSIKIAEEVSGIDLIIDGHSHTEMTEAMMVNGTPIVSAYEWGKVIGTAKIRIQNKEVVGFNWTPISVRSDSVLPNEEITELLQPYVDAAAAELDKVITTSTKKFEFGNRLSRYKEIALGDLVSDGSVWYAREVLNQEIDFGFTNGGNIRAELPAGDITMRDIATVLPFDNWLYVLSMKGSDVISLFEFIGSISQGAGGFAQMSKEVNYTITYDSKGQNGKISDVTINGEAIDPNKTYKVLTNDYLAGGGDGYTVLTKSMDTYNSSVTLRDSVIAYIKQLPKPLNPDTFVDGRITIKGGVATN